MMDHRPPMRDDDPTWLAEQQVADFRKAADALETDAWAAASVQVDVEHRPNLDGPTYAASMTRTGRMEWTITVTAADEHDLGLARAYLARFLGVAL